MLVNLPDMLSRDVGLRLCLAMVELIWMDVSSLQQQGYQVQQMGDMSENRVDNFNSVMRRKINPFHTFFRCGMLEIKQF
jgi:hypothetical protein